MKKVNVNQKCFGQIKDLSLLKILRIFFDKNGIKLYHAGNEEKSSIVERWNITMKNKMSKMFSENNNTVYWNKLDELSSDYNNNILVLK